MAAWSAYQTTSTPFGSWKSIWSGFLAAVASCISVLFLWILTLRPSPQHGVISVLRHLYFAGKSYTRGKYYLRKLKTAWKNPRYAQDQFLMRVLKENGDTDYGRKFKLKNIVSAEEFRKRHSLTTYEDYKPYVERVMAGEQCVMTQVMPNAFVQTSGTTGPSKYFPQRDQRYLLTRMMDVLYTNLHELCPRLGLLQKKLFHYVQPVMSRAKNGGSIRSAFALYEDGFMASCYTTPPSGFRIHSYDDANYIHLVFTLLDPNTGALCGSFLGGIYTMMKQLEQCWEDIVYDIEHGTITEKVKFDDADIRSSLEQALGGGHPERAGELRRQFEKGFNGIMKRVWPNLEVLSAVDNAGSWPDLKAKYAEGIPFVNLGYGNSEAMILGVSPWFHEDNHSMVFCTNMAFFEFIRHEDSNESQPKTLLIDELEIGQEYEIVFTQESGLYRYRLGDVIRITGNHFNCPTFEFMYRMGLIMNLRYEKMNQVVLKAGLQSAVGQWNDMRLFEYAVAESTLVPKSSPAFEETEDMPYYVIFLELDQTVSKSGNKETSKTAELASNEITSSIDAELRGLNSIYERLRRSGAISHPRVHILKPGTFEDLKQHVVNTTNTTANQYKVPQRLRTVDTLNFMFDHAV
eukprot:XP_003728141.1 PREDICTED: 4-substituted benzoates-glutamate ligase GH3.12-like [Strongylocentrotus purpuratus]